MPFDAEPEGWAPVPIESLFKVSTPGHWGEEPATGSNISVLRSTNFKRAGGLNYNTAAPRLFDELKLHQKMLYPGDIILERSGGSPSQPVGRVNRFDAEGVFSASNFMQIMRVAEHVDSYFAYFALDDFYRRGGTEALQKATTGIRNLDHRAYLSTLLLLPPLDEQRRIAEVLHSINAAASAQTVAYQQIGSAFEHLKEASFSQKTHCPLVPLGDACESIQVGIVVRPASYYVQAGGVPALRSLNVGENRLDLNDLVYLSDEGHRLNAKSGLKAGDVVTRRTGEPGKTAVVPEGFNAGLNCIDIIFSRPKHELRPHFLSFFMNSGSAKRQVAGLQGGLAQQHLNVGEMKKILVPIPPLDDQDEVVRTLRDAWRYMETEKDALSQLSAVRAVVASDLLSGRVRVPE